MIRPRRVLVVLAEGLVLPGCITPARQDPVAVGYRLTPACPSPPTEQVVDADEVNQIVARANLPGGRPATSAPAPA